MAHQFAQVLQQRFHRHGIGVQRLLTREGQQPLGEQRAAFCGFSRPGDPRHVRVLRLNQFKTADNHRQQVIKIMRQAAGQLADRFHFLAVNQRLLQPFAFGSVEYHVHQPAPGNRTKAQLNGTIARQL